MEEHAQPLLFLGGPGGSKRWRKLRHPYGPFFFFLDAPFFLLPAGSAEMQASQVSASAVAVPPSLETAKATAAKVTLC